MMSACPPPPSVSGAGDRDPHRFAAGISRSPSSCAQQRKTFHNGAATGIDSKGKRLATTTTARDSHVLILDADPSKAAALKVVMDRYFSVKSDVWSRSRYLCVADDPLDGARRALEYARWSVDEACSLIEANLSWRAKENIDEILKYPLSRDCVRAIRRAFKDEFSGFDVDGYPVYWCPAGRIDIASLKDVVGLEDLVKYHVQTMEFNQQVYLRQISFEKGQTIHRFTCMVDLQGFGPRSLSKAFRETMSAISTIDRDYYYDNFYRVIIVNAPLVFRLFWKTTSALYRAETKAKFIFLDKPSDLERYIHEDQVPARFAPLLHDQPCVFPEDVFQLSKHALAMDTYMKE